MLKLQSGKMLQPQGKPLDLLSKARNNIIMVCIARCIRLSTLVFCLFSPSVFAIYQCTDNNGKVTFQDLPCQQNQQEQTLELERAQQHSATEKASASSAKSLSTKDFELVNIPVDGDTEFVLGFPKKWQASSSFDQNLSVAKLRVTTPENTAQDEKLVLLMTFIPSKKAVGMDNLLLDEMMQELHDNRAGNNNEKKVVSKKLKLPLVKGVGHVMTYRDLKLAAQKTLPVGEFSHLTTGALIIDGRAISITLLSNTVDSDNYQKALLSVQMIAQ